MVLTEAAREGWARLAMRPIYHVPKAQLPERPTFASFQDERNQGELYAIEQRFLMLQVTRRKKLGMSAFFTWAQQARWRSRALALRNRLEEVCAIERCAIVNAHNQVLADIDTMLNVEFMCEAQFKRIRELCNLHKLSCSQRAAEFERKFEEALMYYEVDPIHVLTTYLRRILSQARQIYPREMHALVDSVYSYMWEAMHDPEFHHHIQKGKGTGAISHYMSISIYKLTWHSRQAPVFDYFMRELRCMRGLALGHY